MASIGCSRERSESKRKQSGRLGETEFELVNVWARERGLTGRRTGRSERCDGSLPRPSKRDWSWEPRRKELAGRDGSSSGIISICTRPERRKRASSCSGFLTIKSGFGAKSLIFLCQRRGGACSMTIRPNGRFMRRCSPEPATNWHRCSTRSNSTNCSRGTVRTPSMTVWWR